MEVEFFGSGDRQVFSFGPSLHNSSFYSLVFIISPSREAVLPCGAEPRRRIRALILTLIQEPCKSNMYRMHSCPSTIVAKPVSTLCEIPVSASQPKLKSTREVFNKDHRKVPRRSLCAVATHYAPFFP